MANAAAPRAERQVRSVPLWTTALLPPNSPARTDVVATVARSVIATSQCATVAHGAFAIFTVTPPRMAAANTAPTAPSADRSAPLGPPMPGVCLLSQAARASAQTVVTRIDARYRWLTSTTRSGRLNGGNQYP